MSIINIQNVNIHYKSNNYFFLASTSSCVIAPIFNSPSCLITLADGLLLVDLKSFTRYIIVEL